MGGFSLAAVQGDGALFSPDRVHRYLLWRSLGAGQRQAVFILLNPSTATETENDPTVSRCIRYARDWGFDRMYVVNIFAFRATDPKVMRAHPDPIGLDNQKRILQVARHVTGPTVRDGLIVCAWGNHGDHLDQGRAVSGWLDAEGLESVCLARNRSGHPKHPLYVRADIEPLPFPGV